MTILAKNILIHSELENICKICSQQNIKIVLYRGAAMVEIFPEYTFEREMEDVDVLIEPHNVEQFRKILSSLGYIDREDDPNVMMKHVGNQIVCIDISTGLWYYTKKQNFKIFSRIEHVKKYGSELDCYILPLEEMLKEIYIHSLLHGKNEKKWFSDIKLLQKVLNFTNYELTINNVCKFLVKQNIVYKGHIIKFLFLPFNRKILLLFTTLFPSVKFLSRRYAKGCLAKLGILLYLLRWLMIMTNTFKICLNLSEIIIKRILNNLLNSLGKESFAENS